MSPTTKGKSLLIIGFGAIGLGLLARGLYQASDQGSLDRFGVATVIPFLAAIWAGRRWNGAALAPLIGGTVGGAGQVLFFVSIFVVLSIVRPLPTHPTSRILSEGAIMAAQSTLLGASVGMVITAVLYALRMRAASRVATPPEPDSQPATTPETEKAL
jgi:hypothetical protein